MAKRADFTIEPDLMKGEIDEHDYSRRSARRRRVCLAVVKPQRSRAGPDHRPEWAAVSVRGRSIRHNRDIQGRSEKTQ
jgi:hypothetical protein